MRSGGKLFVFAGVGLALVAVALFVVALRGGGGAADKKAAKVTVVEAVIDIPAHTPLGMDDLVERQVDQADAPADAVASKTAILGKAYQDVLVKGQRLSNALIEEPGLRNDIENGYRAMALPVDEVSALSGLVANDDRVDIVFSASVNIERYLPMPNGVSILEDDLFQFNTTGTGLVGPTDEVAQHDLPGAPGSTIAIQTDIGDARKLEPVAKVLLEDVRVLRVVRPGQSFSSNGVPVESVIDAAGGTTTEGSEAPKGQLILEVNAQQAEIVRFLQDPKNSYQVIVRGKDDHEKASTTGVTFGILVDGEDHQLEVPQPVQVQFENPSAGAAQAAAAGEPAASVPSDGTAQIREP